MFIYVHKYIPRCRLIHKHAYYVLISTPRVYSFATNRYELLCSIPSKLECILNLQAVYSCWICITESCSIFTCAFLNCPHALITAPDDDGCIKSCKCTKEGIDRFCPYIDCKHMKCIYGLEEYANGCVSACRCKPTPSVSLCPWVDCTRLHCPQELVFDENNCIVSCRCRGPDWNDPCPHLDCRYLRCYYGLDDTVVDELRCIYSCQCKLQPDQDYLKQGNAIM